MLESGQWVELGRGKVVLDLNCPIVLFDNTVTRPL